jgi:hypothetical protein
LFNHCLEFYLDTRGFFPKNPFYHSIRGSRSLPKIGNVCSSLLQRSMTCFGPPKEFLRANRDICAWQHTACLGPPKELIRIKCRTPSSSPLGQLRHLRMALRTCPGPPKEFIAPREGSHHQSLRANHKVFTSQHVNSYGPPKDTTEATSKIHLSLAI